MVVGLSPVAMSVARAAPVPRGGRAIPEGIPVKTRVGDALVWRIRDLSRSSRVPHMPSIQAYQRAESHQLTLEGRNGWLLKRAKPVQFRDGTQGYSYEFELSKEKYEYLVLLIGDPVWGRGANTPFLNDRARWEFVSVGQVVLCSEEDSMKGFKFVYRRKVE